MMDGAFSQLSVISLYNFYFLLILMCLHCRSPSLNGFCSLIILADIHDQESLGNLGDDVMVGKQTWLSSPFGTQCCRLLKRQHPPNLCKETNILAVHGK